MKISPIDIAALNGDEMDGDLWLETGSPWPQPEQEDTDEVAQRE